MTKVENVTDEELLSVKNNFVSAMDDDFNTPLAIAELIRFSKIVQKYQENNNLSKQANFLVKMFEDVLGLRFDCDSIKEENQTSANEEKLLNLISEVREKLRQEKNYSLSDYIRDELVKLDISVSDKKI